MKAWQKVQTKILGVLVTTFCVTENKALNLLQNSNNQTLTIAELTND